MDVLNGKPSCNNAVQPMVVNGSDTVRCNGTVCTVMNEGTQQTLNDPLMLTDTEVEEVLRGLEETFTDTEVEELLRGLGETPVDSENGGALPRHPIDDEMDAMLNLCAEDFMI